MVRGGRPLRGRVRVSGAKNAALPLLLASVAATAPCALLAVPPLRDIEAAYATLRHLGVALEVGETEVRLDPRRIRTTDVPPAVARRLRPSTMLLGPLLGRFGQASTALPGGCEIGARPIDYHLAGLRALGAEVVEREGRMHCRADRLRGAAITLPQPSVGATEHLMVAACFAAGETRIANAAREPEVVQLAGYLNAMGARIGGAGESVLHVEGVTGLGGAHARLIPDRVEAGTFLFAAAATGGEITVDGARPDHLAAVLEVLRRAGCRVASTAASVHVVAPSRPRAVKLIASPFPGFPTDLQNPALACLLRCRGTSQIADPVFPERFAVATEFARMGADLDLAGGVASVRGVPGLRGAELHAGADLRGAAALVIAALAAEGTSRIVGCDALQRGYANLAPRLAALGADLEML